MNIELYTAQIFPLLSTAAASASSSAFPKQQLQLHFEGGGTAGSCQQATSKGAPTHCFQRDFTSREVGQREASKGGAGGRTERRRPSPAFTSSSRSHHSKPSANQEASSNPSANQEASSTSVIGGGKFKLSSLAAEN